MNKNAIMLKVVKNMGTGFKNKLGLDWFFLISRLKLMHAKVIRRMR